MSDHVERQTEQILNHLRNIGPITPLEAQERYGCMRLGARIHELKETGVVIETVMITTHNRHGRKVRIARYSLAQAVAA